MVAVLKTIEGCEFDASANTWRVRTSTERLCFNLALPSANQALREGLRDSIARILTRVRPELSHHALTRCRVLLRHAARRRGGPIGALELADFETYRDNLSSRSRERAVETLECLRLLHQFGFNGFAEDLRLALPTLRVLVEPTASPANLACPRDGALTPGELKRVVDSLQEAYAKARVALSNYALCILDLGIAPRPGQAAMLKVRDFQVELASDGSKRYFGTMPLNKVPRTGDEPQRDRRRPIHPAIGAILEPLCEDAVVRGAGLGIAPAECPIFPRHFNKQRVSDWPELPWTLGHGCGSDLSARAIRTFRSLDLSSMRLADPEQRITSTRLRRTLATIARGRGLTYEQVGDLLFHKGSQHPGGRAVASIYCGPSYGFIARVEQAIDFRSLAESYRRALAAAGSNILDED